MLMIVLISVVRAMLLILASSVYIVYIIISIISFILSEYNSLRDSQLL